MDARPQDAAVDAAPMRDAAPRVDATVDAGPPDAALPDAALLDAGLPDAGLPDAGPLDAGLDAAGPLDAALDAGDLDAAPVVDAMPMADAMVDAMPDAALQPDATPDAGPPPQIPPIISEFVAQNQGGLLDEDGASSDWLELYNPGPEPYRLVEHCLSDAVEAPCRWRFPEVILPAHGFMVIFASGKDRAPVDGPLHTNFRLSGDGETLVLANPAGELLDTLDWPGQAPDVAYGRPMQVARETLVGAGTAARLAALGPDGWQAGAFDDAAWQDVSLPLGASDAMMVDPDNPGPLLADSEADFSGVQGQGGWSYGFYDFTNDPDSTYAADDFQPFPAEYYTGAQWDWPNGNPPWTLVGALDVHPNGINNNAEHWAIRRYTVPFGGDLVVEWTVRKSNLNGGGVGGRVMHEGAVLDEQFLAGDDGVGVTRRVVIEDAQPGDRIDLAVGPNGLNGTVHDISDGSISILRVWGAPQLDALFETDVSGLRAPGEPVYVRVPFAVPEGAMRLEVAARYDDGLRAFIDGMPWFDSGALVDRPIADALAPAAFPVDPLAPGDHLLAIEGLDVAGDGQFLLAPTVDAVRIAVDEGVGYLHPSPGAPNDVDGGPVVVELARDLDVGPDQPLRVEARVAYADTVTLTWQLMFQGEQQIEMQTEDGLHWHADLPAAQAGEMVRWFVEASDAEGRSARHPPFPDPVDSERWYGTVVRDDRIETSLPVFLWFMADPAQATRRSGGRGALWFDGRLYDNVFANLHGQSSRGFPKKSYNIDFTKDRRLILDPALPAMKDINFLSNYADKSKLRNTLAYEIYQQAQVDHHLAFPVRVHLNGQFFAVYDFVEDGDDRWLERLGYPDPVGPLYKMYNRLENARGGEKKTRKDEDNSDLAAFSAGLQLADPVARRNYVYDNVDLARMANYLAGMFLIASIDCCHKNYYVYRDPRVGEWWMLPWDVDLSLGRVWTGSYFDDTMYPETPLYMSRSNRLIDALYALPEFTEMYHRRVRSLADAIMQPPGTENPRLEARADALRAHLGADAVMDNDGWQTWGIEQTTDEGVRILKEEWAGPRRSYIYDQLVGREGAAMIRTLLPPDAALSYSVPIEDDGADWTAADFDDAGWLLGALPVGYENVPAEYTPIINTVVRPQDANIEATTVRMRVPFVLDAAPPERMWVRVQYDDGFVAWLNGVEIARRNVGPAIPWNGQASDHPDNEAVRYVDIEVDPAALQMGENLLAVLAVNTNANSSDMLLGLTLVDGLSAVNGPLPEAQDSAAVDVVVEAADPSADAPNEAYVVLHNRSGFAADLTGWRLQGRGIGYDFRPGTVLPTDGRIHIVANTLAFRQRAEAPTGGMGLFVQGDWVGELLPDGEFALLAP